MINASLAVLIMTAAIGSQHALQQLLHSNNRLDIAAAEDNAAALSATATAARANACVLSYNELQLNFSVCC